jgi:Tol biopolymer transport system component
MSRLRFVFRTRYSVERLNFVRVCAVTTTMLVSASLVAQTAPYDSAKPLPHATLFEPGIISTGDYESHAAFTPDGREMYFLKLAPNFSRWTIFVSRYNNGRWSQPEVAPFSGQYQDADPYITPDGKHFYFISDRPGESSGERQSHHDIWVMDKTDSGWSAPRYLPAPVNSDANEWYPVALKNGTLYFGSQRKESNGFSDIYRAVPQPDGSYSVENLGPPVNSGAGEYEAFVTEDERMMLLAITRRPDSLGDIDLYVAHKQPTDKWSEPVNLGSEINSPGRELSPKLTPDGKYLVWMSCRMPALSAKPQRRTTAEVLQELHSPGNGLGNIYQIDVSAVPALKPPK